jgi:transcriptional regulator GlxA family with amidase domain
LLAPESVTSAGTGVRILHVSPLMREMIAEAARWPLYRAPDATGTAFFNAFACLCGEWIENQAPLTLPTTTDPILARALSYVREDLANAVMEGAMRSAGLSERSLRRRCQAQIGMGWDEYRRRARLLAAVEPLTETSDSIARIAADVGFENQSAFARAFRELIGQSPQTFRAQTRR